jgi:hypothetical protein
MPNHSQCNATMAPYESEKLEGNQQQPLEEEAMGNKLTIYN